MTIVSPLPQSRPATDRLIHHLDRGLPGVGLKTGFVNGKGESCRRKLSSLKILDV